MGRNRMPLRTIAGSLMTVALLASCSVGRTRVPPANPNTPLVEAEYGDRIKVACVGDSITFGSGTTSAGGVSNAYPMQLQRMLGAKYDVRNFGVSGATLLKKGDKPYWNQRAFEQSKAFLPDVVVLMLGTNDTKPQNWRFQDQFAADYRELAQEYLALASGPRVWVCHPCVVTGTNNYNIVEANVLLEMPMIDRVARELPVGAIDIYGATSGHATLFPDTVHPNNAGANVLAAAVYEALKGKPVENASAFIAARPAPDAAPR
jgi:lysophospholipase L1-like esterase